MTMMMSQHVSLRIRNQGTIVRLAVIGAAVCLSVFSQSTRADAPAIQTIDPHPNAWQVNGDSLNQITLTFDMPVTIPDGAVSARKLVPDASPDHHGIVVPVVVTLDSTPGVPTDIVVVTTSAPVLSEERLIVVVDYTIANEMGEALNGEVTAPDNPALPTGDGNGNQGGQAVFVFTVLQGDVNRDGVVNNIDTGLLLEAQAYCGGCCNGVCCDGEDTYNENADLNGDGCIDNDDVMIHVGGLGHFLAVIDGDTPLFLSATPGPLPFVDGELVVVFDSEVDETTITRTSVFALGENGTLVTPAGDPTTDDNMTYVFAFSTIECLQTYDFTLSNAVAGTNGALTDQTLFDRIGVDVDPPTITCPQPLFVNSTTAVGIPAGDLPNVVEVQEFLAGATAEDDCGFAVTTSLDTPVDLGLGATTVTFTATDESGHAASCDATIIVVQSVPLSCWDLNENGVPDPNEDINGDGTVDVGDCQGADGEEGPPGADGVDGLDGEMGDDGTDGVDGADGSDGASGNDGIAGVDGSNCWDTNGNGVGDEDEDANADGTFDVLDCQGAEGTAGQDGQPGADAEPTISQETPDTADGTPASSTCGACGPLGMINLLVMLAGVSAMRACCRRHRWS